MQSSSLVSCSILARKYLARARTLATSLRHVHSSVPTYRRRLSPIYRYLRDSQYRHRRSELKRLSGMPRYVSGQTTLLGDTCYFVDAASFLSAYRPIFTEQIYAFRARTNRPVILDCGANIGLAVIYWMGMYPEARITAFEPDPAVFAMLVKNCARFDNTHVILEQRAVWNCTGELRFIAEGADAGHIVTSEAISRPGGRGIIAVPAIQLREYLTERIDLLKLDIEGSETEVILDCADRLGCVNNVFVEFHSYVDRGQTLDEVLRVLREAGFRFHIQPEFVSARPFVHRDVDSGMDQRLNIFAYRA